VPGEKEWLLAKDLVERAIDAVSLGSFAFKLKINPSHSLDLHTVGWTITYQALDADDGIHGVDSTQSFNLNTWEVLVTRPPGVDLPHRSYYSIHEVVTHELDEWFRFNGVRLKKPHPRYTKS